jgi:hypothetical protein
MMSIYEEYLEEIKSSYPYEIKVPAVILRQRIGYKLSKMGLRERKDFRRDTDFFYCTTKLHCTTGMNDIYRFRNAADAIELKLWVPE